MASIIAISPDKITLTYILDGHCMTQCDKSLTDVHGLCLALQLGVIGSE